MTIKNFDHHAYEYLYVFDSNIKRVEVLNSCCLNKHLVFIVKDYGLVDFNNKTISYKGDLIFTLSCKTLVDYLKTKQEQESLKTKSTIEYYRQEILNCQTKILQIQKGLYSFDQKLANQYIEEDIERKKLNAQSNS